MGFKLRESMFRCRYEGFGAAPDGRVQEVRLLCCYGSWPKGYTGGIRYMLPRVRKREMPLAFGELGKEQRVRVVLAAARSG
jgi:hypothetical protein